jgi:hypothetical protein
MAPPTQLTITMIPNSVANSVVIPISSGLQTYETSQQGSAADLAVRGIFRAGCFTPDGGKTWFSALQIISIVAS